MSPLTFGEQSALCYILYVTHCQIIVSNYSLSIESPYQHKILILPSGLHQILDSEQFLQINHEILPGINLLLLILLNLCEQVFNCIFRRSWQYASQEMQHIL